MEAASCGVGSGAYWYFTAHLSLLGGMQASATLVGEVAPTRGLGTARGEELKFEMPPHPFFAHQLVSVNHLVPRNPLHLATGGWGSWCKGKRTSAPDRRLPDGVTSATLNGRPANGVNG